MTTRITIRKPDDWHLHVRDGEMLKAVLPFTARNFGRAILMPNLLPPVRTMADGMAYRERVMAALPQARLSSRSSPAISPMIPIRTMSSAVFATGCSPA